MPTIVAATVFGTEPQPPRARRTDLFPIKLVDIMSTADLELFWMRRRAMSFDELCRDV
jgi:hypothetical protein